MLRECRSPIDLGFSGGLDDQAGQDAEGGVHADVLMVRAGPASVPEQPPFSGEQTDIGLGVATVDR
jgi:hypothetical protein